MLKRLGVRHAEGTSCRDLPPRKWAGSCSGRYSYANVSTKTRQSVITTGIFSRNRKNTKTEQKEMDWDDVQLRGWVSDESAFDKQALKCLRLYQSFVLAPGKSVTKAAGGDRESMLLTGLFVLFPALFGVVVYIACYM